MLKIRFTIYELKIHVPGFGFAYEEKERGVTGKKVDGGT